MMDTLARVCEPQVALAVGLVAWRRPQALRPAAMRAAVVAPVSAAAGWLQDALIPAGEPLAEEAAQALVMQWQETKAQALGARPWPAVLDAMSAILTCGLKLLDSWCAVG